MKIGEIKDMKKEELKKFIEEKRALAVKLRFDIASKQLKNHREYRNTRKDIARALTVLGKMDEANIA
ncbi:MAG: 50S ribosomal protein L29 [Candidatus Moranbacteria bacterium GW2011_GWE1_49_15]|nr:MAG: 50S ribosomal protein L29 [Candidatus Moranbacteria bacterium GW2011_GWE2_47_10]KKW07449.1 MAG: 50S ribosomal protein L29 [Candidatus Moranbacteria bacterium GW2011_GWE1_49_15]